MVNSLSILARTVTPSPIGHSPIGSAMSHFSSRRCAPATSRFSSLCLLLLAILLFVSRCSAHMVMTDPPPIDYKTNPFYTEATADFDYTSPLSPDGSNYPCKGHLSELNTPQGGSVRDYAPGGTYDLVIEGGAPHGGGSCQVALSYDGGNSWTVIKSYIGDCPHVATTGDFNFTIPSDAPAGTVVFAWTWFNEIGNREMYMNCAVVTITGSSSRIKKKRALSGPTLFVANLGNGCSTTEGTDVVFPDPGTDIEYGGDASKQAAPVGSCTGTYKGGGATGTSDLTSGTSGGTSADTSGSGGTAASPSSTSTAGTGGETPTTAADNVNTATAAGTTTPGLNTQTTTLRTVFFTSTVGGTGGNGNTGDTGGAGGAADTATAGGDAAGTAAAGTGAAGTATAGIGTTRTAGSDVGTATSTSTAGTGGGGTTTVNSGTDGQGCDYWRSQGYICSAASPSMIQNLQPLVAGLVVIGFVWGMI